MVYCQIAHSEGVLLDGTFRWFSPKLHIQMVGLFGARLHIQMHQYDIDGTIRWFSARWHIQIVQCWTAQGYMATLCSAQDGKEVYDQFNDILCKQKYTWNFCTGHGDTLDVLSAFSSLLCLLNWEIICLISDIIISKFCYRSHIIL